MSEGQVGDFISGRAVLLPRHQVYVFYSGNAPIDVKRFSRLFKETWQRILLGDRRIILRHWRSLIVSKPVVPEGIDAPTCPIEDYLPRLGINLLAYPDPVFYMDLGYSKLSRTVGRCTYFGHKVTFWSPFIEALPDEMARCLIAHELAHVYLYAIHDESHCEPDGQVNTLFVEGRVFEQLNDYWNFDEESYEEYLKENDHLLPNLPAFE